MGWLKLKLPWQKAKGKRQYDKRQSIKKRDMAREVDREMGRRK